jgi:hypothetical protein
MSEFLAQLPGPIDLRLDLSSLKLGEVLHSLLLAKGHRSGVPRVMAIDHNEPRELAGTLLIAAPTKDMAVAQLEAINTLVRAGTTLTLGSRGSTRSVDLVVLPSSLAVPPFDDGLWEANSVRVAGRVPFRFLCHPYAYGPLLTLYAGAVTYPGVIDINVPGDFESPLCLEFSGTDLHCLWVGRFLDQLTDLPLSDAELLTWTGGVCANVADAGAHGGMRVDNSGIDSWGAAPVTDTAYPPGTYMMLGRVGSSDATESRYTAGTSKILTVTDAGLRLEEFGIMRLPQRRVRGVAASSFSVSMAPTGGVARYDYVCPVPISNGWACYHPTSGSEHVDKLVLDTDGVLYGDDVAVGDAGKSGGLCALGAQRLVVVADHVHGSGAAGGTIKLQTTITTTPRYALWA